jgi:hypothetical protein
MNDKLGKTQSWPIPVFAWSDSGKTRETSLWIAGTPVRGRTENLPNASVERYRFVDLLNKYHQMLKKRDKA